VYTETRVSYNSQISDTLRFPAALSSRRCEISTFTVFVSTFCFDNSSVLGVLKSTKLPHTTTEVQDLTMTGTTVAKGYV